jgi:hypothetical protein
MASHALFYVQTGRIVSLPGETSRHVGPIIPLRRDVVGPITELNALPILVPQPRARAHRPRRAPRERRAAQRTSVELECEERVGPHRYFRVTQDISPFGLSTRYGYPHAVGTKLELWLYLPDDPTHPVKLQAEVVGQWPDEAGVRVAFRNPSGEAVRRISKVLSTLP